MRVALLPSGPDPFLLAYWLRNYRTWGQYIDELCIVVCGQDDPTIQSYLVGLAHEYSHLSRITLRFAPRTDHGTLIRELLEQAESRSVLLCEDDAFVCSPEKIDQCFKLIESGEADIIGCPRATGSEEVVQWARERYGDWQVEPTGESGPLLWPCFLFAQRATLLRTDRHFGAWSLPAGVAMIDQTFASDQAMDTFGWATIQLREVGCRIRVEPNYRAQLWGLSAWQDAPWFHVGGLSTGYGMYLAEPNRLEYQESVKSDPVDWGKRISWWKRVAEKSDGVLPVADYLAAANELASLIDTVPEWYTGFDKMITWMER